jgi:hypothetical protein
MSCVIASRSWPTATPAPADLPDRRLLAVVVAGADAEPSEALLLAVCW